MLSPCNLQLLSSKPHLKKEAKPNEGTTFLSGMTPFRSTACLLVLYILTWATSIEADPEAPEHCNAGGSANSTSLLQTTAFTALKEEPDAALLEESEQDD